MSNLCKLPDILNLGLLEPYEMSTFIETGTWRGDTAMAAMLAGYDRVYTIDNNYTLYQDLAVPLANEGIFFVFGQSLWALPEVLKVEGRAVVWLDAHTDEDVPLLGELAAVGDADGEYLVLIDDATSFGSRERPGWARVTRDLVLRTMHEYGIGRLFDADGDMAPNDIIVGYKRGRGQ